ncbi:MAG: AMP-binding protein [Thermodesulfobacteriota bacterium]
MFAPRLRQWAEKEPERTALAYRNKEGAYSRVSFRDLYRSCLAAESNLAGMGLKAGDRIALYGENSISWVISYFSIHFLGATVVPLDSLFGAREIINFLDFSESKAVLTDPSRADKLRAELTGKSPGINVIVMDDAISGLPEDLSIEPSIPEPDDVMAILFTSGTTGTPKGVQLTNDNVLSTVKAILQSVDVSPDDNILNILPLHHGYSSIVALLSPLFAGASVTFSESLKSGDLLAAVRETTVTIFPGVPRLFELIYNDIEKRVARLPLTQRLMFRSLFKISELGWKILGLRLGRIFFGQIHEPFGGQLRFFTSGGARLDPRVFRGFLSLGFRMAEGYGLTETTAISTLTSPYKPAPGSAGKPLPGVEVRIDNPDAAGTGEICIKGPNITVGYYKNEAATRELLREGWLYSGDLGSLDREGYLYITGRAKEVIVLPTGKNIYPEDVENLYKESPLIREMCVIPLKSPSGSLVGLRMVVVPEMKEIQERGIFGVSERIRSIISMKGSSLPSYMQISDVIVYNEELPKTRLGKFKRNEIEKIAEELKSGEEPLRKMTDAEDAELLKMPQSASFLNRFSEMTDLDGPFHPDDDLTLDLGLDSLMLVQIMDLLEKEYSVFIPESEIPKLRTIGDILRKLPGQRPQTAGEEKTPREEREGESLDEIFNLRRGVLKRTAMRAVQLIVRLIVLLAFRAKIRNTDKIPADTPLLICPNHQSMIDPILVFALLPGRMLDRLLFTGFGEYFARPPLSWLVRPFRIILTGTARTYGESLRLASEGLKRGMSVCIFPEGERTSTGKVMKPRAGAGLLSVENGVPIVPVYIEGALKTLSPLNPGLRFPTVTLTVMDPIEPARGDREKNELYETTLSRWLSDMKEMEGTHNTRLQAS